MVVKAIKRFGYGNKKRPWDGGPERLGVPKWPDGHGVYVCSSSGQKQQDHGWCHYREVTREGRPDLQLYLQSPVQQQEQQQTTPQPWDSEKKCLALGYSLKEEARACVCVYVGEWVWVDYT